MPHRAAIRYARPAYEPALPRDQRRTAGAYYTPPEVVRLMADLALDPLLADSKRDNPPRIVDPACGAGEFLVEAADRLLGRFGKATTAAALAGVDIDAAAVEAARQRLQRLGLPRNVILQNIRCADGLAAGTFDPASFDCVLANPPYVSIRQLAKSRVPAEIADLRQRFRTASGNFDLYVLFIERAIGLLVPGGRCGLIVPNKWATLDYARGCRELLLAETTLEQVIDLSASRVFSQASVYPHVLVLRREPAASSHEILYSNSIPSARTRPGSGAPPRAPSLRNASPEQATLLQRLLSPVAISFTTPLDVESRVATVPLGQLCTLSCGTAGFAAQRIALRLVEADDDRPLPEPSNAQPRNAPQRVLNSADFITSGNIDRYEIALGNVRYLKRRLARPRLPLDAPELTDRKRRLFRSPKIVIAGMSRRLEAAWDDRGLALGVQVFAASDFPVDPFYLLALLNSKLLSYLFRTRFAAKRLAGGYLAINKGQLARLPIAIGDPVSPGLRSPGSGGTVTSPLCSSLRETTCFREAKADVVSGPPLSTWAHEMSRQATSTLDAQIDRLVYRQYRLTTREIARVEAELAEPIARAA
jgi:SAM-dependent methyltransferase